MTQTLALLLDAYRDLNARKLFWVTLILTALFMGAFALLGFNDNGLTMAGYQFEFPLASTIYKTIFSDIIIGFWLTWVAIILALISTAGIFPDLITGGSVELYLARPISRLRLFLIKYVCGLLFVGIQVLVVSLSGYLLMGLRGKIWMPSLFLAIPIVMLMFSYLYAVCVLLGIWTRSTIAALMLTLLAWAIFFSAQKGEQGLLVWRQLVEGRVDRAHRVIAEDDEQLHRLAQHPEEDRTGFKAGLARMSRQHAVDSLPELEHDAKMPRLLHQLSYALRVIVPKTSETTNLLDRWMMSDTEVLARPQQRERRMQARGRDEQAERIEATMDVEEIERHRSVAWIIGTSLIDEVVLLGLAAWLFCRRDY